MVWRMKIAESIEKLKKERYIAGAVIGRKNIAIGHATMADKTTRKW
jgi:hypothetical protein